MIMKVVVTGGTKGIGRAIIEVFFAQGADIAFCARNADDVEQLNQELFKRDPSRSIVAGVADVSKKEDVISFSEEINKRWNTIDALVNNAGVFIPGEILDEDEGSLEHMINTNLYSAYNLTRALVPQMIDRGGGHIFNICSVASLLALPGGGSYSISKFALLGFSKVLREELKAKGVKVTSVMPGATWSNSWAGVELPVSRLMQADDVAKQIWAAYDTSVAAVIEDIVLRPQLGDL
jgi:short-subunit dehydrogenase